MGLPKSIRAQQAAERQQQREAQRRQRELARRAKEQAKLTAVEQARLEVETYENRLEVLLSVHKSQDVAWDWLALAAILAPVCPQRFPRHEFKLKRNLDVLAAKDQDPNQLQAREAAIEQARLRDEQEFQDALEIHNAEHAEWEKMRGLACRILSGEHKAYIEALGELSPFSEISDLGSSIHFTIHNAKMLECVLTVKGRQAIPSEVKSLTTTGKVSIKSMPKTRFHEIYQDYVCGCVLRVAREVFALLPVENLLITASADILDQRTGQTVERPVLSVAIPCAVLSRLDFDRLDPSDAMENFFHRGDFKASRGSGEFDSIVPLSPADLPRPSTESMDFRELIATVRTLRNELTAELKKLRPQSSVAAAPTSEPL